MSKYGLRFDLVETPRQIRQLGDFMRANVGSYGMSRHQAWVDDVCLPGVERGERPTLAWWEHGRMIGDSVLKVVAPNIVEVKNFRIRDGYDRHSLGSVMMDYTMDEAVALLDERGAISSDTNAITVQLDTGPDLETYFASHHFVTVGKAELYVPGREEVIMQRTVPLQ